jgi:hypothetical protein
MYTTFWSENIKGKAYFSDAYGGIILKYVLREVACYVLDWIHLIRDRIQWQNFGSTVMNFPVS